MRTPLYITATAFMVILSACGQTQPKTAKPLKPTPIATLKLGPVRLKSGSVWELNNPGGGTPRESLVIQAIHGQKVTAEAYVGEFGSLIQANLRGKTSAASTLVLSGTVSEASVTGASRSRPIHLTVKGVGPHTFWVTQSISGDTLNSFSQIPFKETSS